mmetsp:Transcript_23852/g.42688  ORF Transcript_23852/g.42688 Transcript_23852/m.42688 type:complete len:202 (-) Transcript_23852:152-757(-)
MTTEPQLFHLLTSPVVGHHTLCVVKLRCGPGLFRMTTVLAHHSRIRSKFHACSDEFHRLRLNVGPPKCFQGPARCCDSVHNSQGHKSKCRIDMKVQRSIHERYLRVHIASNNFKAGIRQSLSHAEMSHQNNPNNQTRDSTPRSNRDINATRIRTLSRKDLFCQFKDASHLSQYSRRTIPSQHDWYEICLFPRPGNCANSSH